MIESDSHIIFRSLFTFIIETIYEGGVGYRMPVVCQGTLGQSPNNYQIGDSYHVIMDINLINEVKLRLQSPSVKAYI